MAMPDTQKRRRARVQLAALAALFLAGGVIASLMIASGWRPTHTRNYGQLITPAHPIADVKLTVLDGGTAHFHDLRGKWNLIYFGPSACSPSCTDNLYKMRQIVTAQGKDAERVQRVFVVTETTSLDRLRDALVEHPGITVYTGPIAQVRSLAAQFASAAGDSAGPQGRIHIVDPLGNYIMSYPADADPTRMLKDLSLLLRASRIG